MSKERFVSRVTLGPVRLVININQQRDGKSSEGQKREHDFKKVLLFLLSPNPTEGTARPLTPQGCLGVRQRSYEE